MRGTQTTFEAITKSFETEYKALSLRVIHRVAFARLAVYDGYLSVRMGITVANCTMGQTSDE